MFDVLNSSRLVEQYQYKRALAASTEKEHLRVLNEAREWLGRWAVPDGPLPDSTGGLMLTLDAVEKVWEQVKDSGKLFTRRLNQDALENFFGVIRQAGGDNYKPDPSQFRQAYRKSAVNSVLCPSVNGNCEPDTDGLLAAFTSVAARTDCPVPATVAHVSVEPPPALAVEPSADDVTDNVLTYIAGYLCAKGSATHSCAMCKAALQTNRSVAMHDREALTALKSFTGERLLDVGSLVLPTDTFFSVVKATYEAVQHSPESLMCRPRLAERLVSGMLSNSVSLQLKGAMCDSNALEAMVATFVRLLIHRRCSAMTSASVQRGTNKQNRKYVKVSRRL